MGWPPKFLPLGVSFSLSKICSGSWSFKGFERCLKSATQVLTVNTQFYQLVSVSPQEQETQYSLGRLTGLAKHSVCSINTDA